ncbi:MAG TPA: hypothetical protein VLM85_10810 [Polyangiaceae bacterium]|nr:hypothetical protein [Polyangiaceae bacterium]
MRLASLAAALAFLTGTARAYATPRSARLVYSRTPDAESCPDEAALGRAVTSRVGQDVFSRAATTTVVARFSRDPGGAFVATVKLIDEGAIQGTRELRATTCDALLGAAALAISIAVDPPTPARPTRRARDYPYPDSSEDAPATPPKKRVLEVIAGATGSAGHAPAPAVGGALGVAMRWARGSVAVEGHVDAPSSAGVEGGGSVQSWLAFGALVPCLHLGQAFACAVAQVGSLQAASTAVNAPRSASALWLGAGGRIGVDVVAGSVFVVRLHMDVVGNLSPTTLRVNGFDAWTTPPVNGSAGLDWVVRFL